MFRLLLEFERGKVQALEVDYFMLSRPDNEYILGKRLSDMPTDIEEAQRIPVSAVRSFSIGAPSGEAT